LLCFDLDSRCGIFKKHLIDTVVKAKTKRTSESWIATVFFVMNLAAWFRKDLFLSFFKMLEIVKERLMNRSQLVFCGQS